MLSVRTIRARLLLLAFAAGLPPAAALAWQTQGHPDRSLALALAALAPALALAVWLARRIARPIDELARTADAVVAGEATARTRVNGLPELAAVARAFNHMLDVQERADAALRESENLKRDILASSLDCIVAMDCAGTVVEFNPAAEATFGYRRAEVLGRRMAELLIPPHLRAAHERGLARHLAGGEARMLGRRLEVEAMRADGAVFPVELSITTTRGGAATLFVAFMRDITERKAAEQRIRRLNRVYAVLSGINSAIVRTRSREELFHDACRIAVDEGGFRMAWIGLVDREAMLVQPVASAGAVGDFFEVAPLAVLENRPGGHGLAGRAVRELRPMVSNDVQADPQRLMKRELAERGINSVAIFALVVDGAGAGVLAFYAAETGAFDADELRLLSELAQDVSFALAHLEQEAKLDYLASHDPLTGLANRDLFLRRLQRELERARSGGSIVALTLLDLQRFKAVNDALGRQAGDELLRQVAARLLAGDEHPRRVARLGNDIFAVITRDARDAQAMGKRTEERSREIFGRPFVLADTEIRADAHFGIALFPADGTDGEALLRHAEAALKKARERGERCVFFDPEMTARVAEKLSLETRLRRALEHEEFVLHYQPKVVAENGRVAGVEALIRWQSPDLGLVPPAKFIALLEETGLIFEVGGWALKRAAHDHRRWAEALPRAPRVAVNVSPRQLRQKDFVERVEQALMEGVAPAGIDLEITESAIMDDIAGNIDKLKSVRALGIKVAIDDFGTGYSSLAYLARLPVQALKIDRSFVVTMLEDGNTMTLVQTIISLARSLRLEVVAEGVETEEQAKVLRLLRCEYLQGFLFSRPLPFEELTPLLGAPL